MQAGSNSNASGLDVSEFQGLITWAQVRAAGKAFAFIRAAYGHNITDAMFAANWLGAQKAGLVVGAYHYVTPQTSDANTQVAYFLHIVNQHGGIQGSNLPPAMDLEECGSMTDAQLRDWAVAYCNALDAAIKNPDQRTMVYSYPSFIADHPLTFGALADRLLWIPSYGRTPANVGPWKEWTAWQYSDTGKIPGILDATDLDEWHTDPAGLIHVTTPPPMSPEIPQLQSQLAAAQAEITRLNHVVAAIQGDLKGV